MNYLSTDLYKKVVLTQDELVKAVVFWRNVLKLNHWAISPEVKRHYDMKAETIGGACWTLEKYAGSIGILDPVDYSIEDHRGWPFDMEKTTVHELLHLLFAPFEEGEGELDVIQEQVIEKLSLSLVNLNRCTFTLHNFSGVGSSLIPLETIMNEWKTILFLNQWEIIIKYGSDKELGCTETQTVRSSNVYHLVSLESIIRILNPEEYHTEKMIRSQLIEESIIHELLHLWFAPFMCQEGSLKYIFQEQAICILSRAFLDIKYKVLYPANC